MRRKIKQFHSDNISSEKFWSEHPCLLRELGRFTPDARKINPEYTESFHLEEKLLQATWVVIRIDGCHFHRFYYTSECFLLLSFFPSDSV